ncbi:MAG: flagellar M-ring protein FliF [Deltaproteobacteria bacterium]|nr:flagellar M-ring protein FliF [Deltaproteobacteria bacterium]MBI3295204.1 flagellar M-ring protein FliF [Deltaproteobacteria bacterium]
MPESLTTFIATLRAQYARLSRAQRIGVLVGLAVTGAGLATALTFQLKQDPYQILYTDLHPEDFKAVAKHLSEAKIPYHVADDQATILVPAGQIHMARMNLAKDGVPGHDLVGFEKFDGSTLGMSSYVQKIQYVRAVQGELTRSIQRLAAVKTARVHISIPPKKTFLEEQEAPKASVVLELRSGMAPSKQEIQGVAHLVASAVEGLQTNQITIVDTKGNFLHRPEDESMHGLSSALLEMQRTIEIDYEKRIVELLTPVVGFDKVRAKVTTEMDPSRVNTTEETYDPEKAVARSVVKNDEVTTGSRPNPIGIPGSRSNLPGTENTNPPIPMANTSTEKNLNNSQYAIPRKIQTTDKPSGNIKRLTVAVVVDGYYTKSTNPNDVDTFTPRTEEELKRLQDIVANAVGFDSQRRDSITVSSLPFKSIDVTEPKSEIVPPAGMPVSYRIGLALLGLLIAGFGILRPIMKRRAAKQEAERLAALEKEKTLLNQLPKTIAELEASKQAELLKAAGDAGAIALSEGEAGEEDTPDQKEQADLIKKILDKLQQSPKKGVRIIQEWIEKDEMERVPVPEVA